MAHHRFHETRKFKHTAKSDLRFHRNGVRPSNAMTTMGKGIIPSHTSKNEQRNVMQACTSRCMNAHIDTHTHTHTAQFHFFPQHSKKNFEKRA